MEQQPVVLDGSKLEGIKASGGPYIEKDKIIADVICKFVPEMTSPDSYKIIFCSHARVMELMNSSYSLDNDRAVYYVQLVGSFPCKNGKTHPCKALEIDATTGRVVAVRSSWEHLSIDELQK